MRPLLLALCALALAAADGLPDLGLAPAFAQARFDRPLWVGQIPGSERFLVLEQAGRALTVDRAGATAPFLDLSDAVRMPGGYTEEGLLSAAFHPRFAENRQLLLWYTTRRSGHLQTILARWRVDPTGATAVAGSEEELLAVDQPYANHNGGDLHFGSDGFLYLSLGDGGSGGDPHNNAQNLGSLLGKILRLDVDHRDGANLYASPVGNPFADRPGARPEIWAYGLRNVWRMSFDRTTGELWAGDVGQNAFEEIDVIVKGGNYGWRVREGLSAFKDGERQPGMLDPVWDYPRTDGQSVTGGFVYRGAAIPELVGAYIFGDWASKRIWALRRTAGKAQVRQVATCAGQISSFGCDAAGELYVCGFDGVVYAIRGR